MDETVLKLKFNYNMFIYKITNTINKKIYIGQVYNKSVQDRFERHIREVNPKHPIILDRAIYKYGKENFVCEQIDSANSLEELNQKEKYWIKYYNSTNRNIGYNLTDGGDGGNTYKYKSVEEMNDIKNKISIANSGKNNGQSKQIKALNVNTKELIHFDTLTSALQYFNHKHKETIISRCEKQVLILWRNEWTFAYENEDFMPLDSLYVYDKSCHNGTKVKLVDLISNEEKIFNSLNKLNNYLGITKNAVKYTNNEGFYKNYKIIKF